MDRLSYWAEFINSRQITSVAEIGVWKGEFAEAMLQRCPALERYYLIDPWRHLEDWNKPLNEDDLELALIETQERVQPFESKCTFLRGRTIDVADELPEIDFAYIDGDHTLRGIVIDMIKVWPKIRVGGWLGGDDLSPSIWQHSPRYEPSLVFPFAVHFAEAMKCPMVAPGGSQFYIEKTEAGFTFSDPEGRYPTSELLPQLQQPEPQSRIKRGLLKLAGR